MASDGHGFAKGTVALGLGIYAYVQNMGTLAEILEDLTIDVEDINKNVKAVQMGITQVLDNQVSLLALSDQRLSDVRECLDSLEVGAAQGSEAAIIKAGNKEAQQIARMCKERVQLATFAYDDLVSDIVGAAEKSTGRQSQTLARSMARDSAVNAEGRAEELYAWAMTHLPDFGHRNKESQVTGLNRHQKLGVIPYIVAMAYAVRIKIDARMVKSHSMEDKDDRERHLMRSRSIVGDFVSLLRAALMATVIDVSLLEMALDCHLPMATYMMLMKGIQASAQTMVEKSETINQTKIEAWDDGLSKIRSLVRRGVDGINFIELDSVRKCFWWLHWIDADLGNHDIYDVRQAVPVRELCLVLGALQSSDDNMDDDRKATSFHLMPEYEATLFELPSAQRMRDFILDKLASALDTTPDSLQSVARIGNASDIPTPFAHRVAKPRAISPLAPQLAHTLTGHSQSVFAVAMSWDGQRAVSISSDNTARVWNPSTGQAVQTLTGHSDSMLSVGLFADAERAVTGGSDNTLRFWNINTGTQLGTYSGHSGAVRGVAVAPDDLTVASASDDTTIKLWNVKSECCIATLKGHGDLVKCVAWSVDGQTLASVSADHTIRVWKTHSPYLLRTISQRRVEVVNGVAFAGDMLVSCCLSGIIKVWEWQTGTLKTKFSQFTSNQYCIAAMFDQERIVSGSSNSGVCIWNLCSGVCERTLISKCSIARSVAVSRNGRTLVTGCCDGSVMVWRLY